MIRCLAKDVLLLRAFASQGIRLPSCCLAMGICVTISTLLESGKTVLEMELTFV
jgi:ferredoxin